MTRLRHIAAFTALWGVASTALAQQMPGAVLELKFTPAPRAQIAVWLEREDGRFIRTLALTEAVAFRGIGNRPGATQMNSGYRWPYGRREGVLSVWAARRAAAPNAQPFRRVIFQDRLSEGRASRTSSDHSIDDYFCLSFDRTTTTRDALDAVSCASVFTSDKGRFITADDVSAGYAEPWEDPTTHVGMSAPLPLISPYPPRMDAERCTTSGCYDHLDVAEFAAHTRAVMPEIDAVTMATPPGHNEQSMLFSLPVDWPRGRYYLWFEINVEGDYNDSYNDSTYATPTQPTSDWDSWAIDYGYPYRGQPSLAFALPFELAGVGDASYAATEPEGRSSWDVWSAGYGALESMSGISDDPASAPGSGADRLQRDAEGNRLTLLVQTLSELPEPEPGDDMLPDITEGGTDPAADPEPDVTAEPDQAPQPGDPASPPSTPMQSGAEEEPPLPEPAEDGSEGVILPTQEASLDGPVGPVRELTLRRHPDPIHAHEWIKASFVAAESVEPLHRYEVRVSTQPITDERSFIQRGRPAKTASVGREGAVSLTLPIDVPPGERIETEIGDLLAQTEYWVAVRAVDRFNRRGPISVGRITTDMRTFTTVTPCFVASAAYGTPLAQQVGALRRLRDRHLLTDRVGRALARLYYAHGERLAAPLRHSPLLRSIARGALTPIVSAARWLAD